MPRELAQVLTTPSPLVLCTSTSVRHRVHQRHFPCVYPDSILQELIDVMIDHILQGRDQESILERLMQILRNIDQRSIILGCTELSLFYEPLKAQDPRIIDPLEIIANKILEKSFCGEKS